MIIISTLKGICTLIKLIPLVFVETDFLEILFIVIHIVHITVSRRKHMKQYEECASIPRISYNSMSHNKII